MPALQTQPPALHNVIMPESGELPRGWLNELRERYEAGPEGFVALDRTEVGEAVAPVVRGWGIDPEAALLSAGARSHSDRAALQVFPCTAMLRELQLRGPAGSFLFEGVAYAQREPSPVETIEEWLSHRINALHADFCADPADLDEMLSIVGGVGYAFLKAHPAVAIAEDGRLGWSERARMRGEIDDSGIAPLSPDLERAWAELKTNVQLLHALPRNGDGSTGEKAVAICRGAYMARFGYMIEGR